MAAGLQVFNPDGTLQFDTTNRLFRTLTSVQTGTSNGSIAIPPNSGGTLVAVVIPTGATGRPARPTISGSTVSWDFSAPVNERTDSTLSLVVY